MVLCATNEEHAHIKDVARGEQPNKLPFIYRREPEAELQPEEKQTDDNSWPQLIKRDRIMNTMLSQLRSGPVAPVAQPWTNEDVDSARTYVEENQFQDEAVADYVESSKATWDRGAREVGRQKYYSICLTERTTVTLTDSEYEYRPSHYEEIRCISNGYNDRSDKTICSTAGFECMQWNETIHVTRRKINDGCWKTYSYTVPKGCECMWPEHKLGKLETYHHHQA
ncbi:uncharacterized protein LOC143922537 isoform X2 [Arctopsyche grandis]